MPVCAACGQENPEGFRFCGACGAPLIERPAALLEERKLVTVLFADVTGSTGLGELLDSEALKDVMETWFSAMRAEIEAEGGTVEKFIGDAVMAAFGVPAAHEDDASRALRAALRMQARLEKLNDELEGLHGVRLEVRTGVNTGEVMASTAPRPGEAMATGDAVNAAARLQQAAEPGQILVSERTARASRGFRLRGLGELRLAGKEGSVPTLELLPEQRPAERGIPGIRAPMVGRDRELGLLSSLYERVCADATPHLVTVYGDPGVGKSRLLQEFAERAASASPALQLLVGRCLPYGEGVTYWPFAEILKTVTGVLDSDPADVALAKIRAHVDELALPGTPEDARRTAAALAYTVGLDDPEVSFRVAPPRQVRVETYAAWRSFFSALAGAQPVLVVVEDIHWAERELLDLVEELADRVQGAVLVLCSARPELTGRRPSWGGGRRNASSVFLEPLSRAAADRLMSFLLDVDELPGSVRASILGRAEGNPFFLEEIVRKLMDEGRIVEKDGRWRAAGVPEDFELPDTIQAVLAARIDLLEDGDKRVLQQAAVVGRVFWDGSVAALLNGDADELEGALRRLEERDLVRARLGSSIAGQEEFAFKHVLTRNVAYETLPRRSRGSSHANVAAWIEATAGERSGELVELLAHHYVEAHESLARDPRTASAQVEVLRAKAFEHLLSAAADGVKRMVLEKARRLGEQALTLADGPLERARAQELLGEAYVSDFRGDEAWSYFTGAIDTRLAGVPDDHMAIAHLCGRALEIPLRWAGTMLRPPTEGETRRYLDVGFARLEPGDSEARVRLLAAHGFWAHGFSTTPRSTEERERARQDAEEGAAMALRLGRPELALTALDAVQSTYDQEGRIREALAVAERRLELSGEIRDAWELGDMFAMLSAAHYGLGNFDEAVEAGSRGFEVTLDENPVVALHCLSYRAAARFRKGDWKGAFEDLATTTDMLGPERDPIRGAALPWAIAAFAHEVRGETAAADRCLAITARLEAGLTHGSDHLSPWIARTLARRGSLAEARERLDAALAIPTRGRRPELLQAGCELIALTGAWDEAPALVRRGREEAEYGGSRMLGCAADLLAGEAALATGDLEAATGSLRAAAEGYAGLGAEWDSARASLLLAEALLAAGDETEASSRLEYALEVFDRLGAVDGLAGAQGLRAKARALSRPR